MPNTTWKSCSVYIVLDLKAKPFMAYNRRNVQDQAGFRREAQRVFCPANLLMHRHGRMTVKGTTYIQYKCPLHYGPHLELLLCPAGLREARWRETDLALRRKGDPVKIALARRLRQETTMPLKWICERLAMGSWKAVSRRLYVNE